MSDGEGRRGRNGWRVQIGIIGILKGKINPFPALGGIINSLYDFQGSASFRHIHGNRRVVTYRKVKVVYLCIMAHTPIIGNGSAFRCRCRLYFRIAAVKLIEADILLQTAAAFFALEFQKNRGIGRIGICGIKAVETAVFKMDGGLGGIFHPDPSW